MGCLRRCTFFIYLLLFIDQASSQPVFISAMIQDEVGVMKRFPFPNFPKDFSATIRCLGVTRQTRLWEVQCTSEDDEYLELAKRVRKYAESNFSISRAYIDEEQTTVLIKFTIEFRKSGNRKNISIFQNYGLNPLLSAEYLGPQRILSFRLAPISERGSCRSCPHDTPILVLSKVNSYGNVSGVDVLTTGLSSACIDGVLTWARFQRYIPALHSGSSVDALTTDVIQHERNPTLRQSCP